MAVSNGRTQGEKDINKVTLTKRKYFSERRDYALEKVRRSNPRA
jgi:hypothetical protein